MKNLMQSILITLAITFLNLAISAYQFPDYLWDSEAIVGQFVFGVLIGIVLACANQLFKMKWPLITIVLVHHVILVVTIGSINFSYLKATGEWLNLYLKIAIPYFLIWLYFYVEEKRAITKMNATIQERSGSNGVH